VVAVQSVEGTGTCAIATTSTPALERAHIPKQWVLGALFWEVKQPEHEVDLLSV
jgi:hypothetical protein